MEVDEKSLKISKQFKQKLSFRNASGLGVCDSVCSAFKDSLKLEISEYSLVNTTVTLCVLITRLNLVHNTYVIRIDPSRNTFTLDEQKSRISRKEKE